MTAPIGYTLVFQSAFNVAGYVPVSNDWDLLIPYVLGSSGIPQFLGHTPYDGDFGSAYFTPPGDPSGQPSAFTQNGTSLIINPYLDNTSHWRSGMISTVDERGVGFSQALGYWEASFTMPPGGGTWPSFWLEDMLSIQRGSRTQTEYEIDVCELYGYDTYGINSHFHIWAANGSQIGGADNYLDYLPQWVGTTSLTSQSGAHIYGVQITTSFITVFLDNVQIWQTPSPSDIASHQFYGMVDYALGAGYPITITSGTAPMWIQYMQAYAPSLTTLGETARASLQGSVNLSFHLKSILLRPTALAAAKGSGNAFAGLKSGLLSPGAHAQSAVTSKGVVHYVLAGIVYSFPKAFGAVTVTVHASPRFINLSQAIPPSPDVSNVLVTAYSTVQGDMFDSIAYQIYKSERFAPTLMRENPTYSGTVKFDAGIVLNVPTVSSSRNISNVPWGLLIVS